MLNNQLTHQWLTLVFDVTYLMLNNQLTYQWLTLGFYVTNMMLKNQLTHQWPPLGLYVTDLMLSVAYPGILCDNPLVDVPELISPCLSMAIMPIVS